MSRLWNLLRGVFGEWVVRHEHRNPAAVYEAAIRGRVERYAALRQAAAGVLYMKEKLGRDLQARSEALHQVESELGHAVDAGDDEVALALLSNRDLLRADIERLNKEVAEVTAEADAAKRNLIAFQDEIGRLREEKLRMVARWANARARKRFQETLRGFSLDADIRALEEVRDSVNRAVSEVKLGGELDRSAVNDRLEKLREADALQRARDELSRLRRAREQRLLPVALTA